MTIGVVPECDSVDEEGRVFEERRAIQLHTGTVSVDGLLGSACRIHHRYWSALEKSRQELGEEGRDQSSKEPHTLTLA